jgi:hypothetical protein
MGSQSQAPLWPGILGIVASLQVPQQENCTALSAIACMQGQAMCYQIRNLTTLVHCA